MDRQASRAMQEIAQSGIDFVPVISHGPDRLSRSGGARLWGWADASRFWANPESSLGCGAHGFDDFPAGWGPSQPLRSALHGSSRDHPGVLSRGLSGQGGSACCMQRAGVGVVHPPVFVHLVLRLRGKLGSITMGTACPLRGPMGSSEKTTPGAIRSQVF